MSKSSSYYIKEGIYGMGLLLLTAPAYSTDSIVYTGIMAVFSLILVSLVMVSLLRKSKTTELVLRENISKQTFYFLFVLPGAFILGSFIHGEALAHRAVYSLISLALLLVLSFVINKYLHKIEKEKQGNNNSPKVVLFYLLVLIAGGGLYVLSIQWE